MNRQAWTRSWFYGPTAALTCILLSGCIKDRILVKVNKDGTGKIIVTKIFSKETADQFRTQMQMMRLHGGMEDEEEVADMAQKDPLFNEKALKMQAGRFGPQVSFAKARKFSSGGACGYVAIYNFKDVNDIFLDLQSLSREGYSGIYGMMRGMSGEEGEDVEIPIAEKSTESVEFRLTPGPSSKLQILIPGGGDASSEGEDAEEEAPQENEEGEEAFADYGEEMAMYAGGGAMYASMAGRFMGVRNQDEATRRMMKGMAMNLEVEVEGTDIKSNASHSDPKKKGHITLLSFDADQIMASPQGIAMMRRASRGQIREPRDFLAAAARLPGAMIETNREVVVEFK